MDLKGRGPFMLKVQSCDSIGQVKNKVLDAVCKGKSYSHRPGTGTFELGRPAFLFHTFCFLQNGTVLDAAL